MRTLRLPPSASMASSQAWPRRLPWMSLSRLGKPLSLKFSSPPIASLPPATPMTTTTEATHLRRMRQLRTRSTGVSTGRILDAPTTACARKTTTDDDKTSVGGLPVGPRCVDEFDDAALAARLLGGEHH